MDLLLVRHGIAGDPTTAGRAADARRALTPEGRRRMARAARGLAWLVGAVDVVATSPLLRAAETAALLAEAFGRPGVVELPALAPGARLDGVIAWLTGRRRARTVALVGHEPHLSALAALLVAGEAHPIFTLRKGGAALLELERPAAPGEARLRWLATPLLLRRLGGTR